MERELNKNFSSSLGFSPSLIRRKKQDEIKVDFRGINKFYGERINFSFKKDLIFDKMQLSFRSFFDNFEKEMKEDAIDLLRNVSSE